jgi:hypothetical protein
VRYALKYCAKNGNRPIKLETLNTKNLICTCVQNTRDNLKEVSRIGVNAAKTFEQTSRDTIAARSVGF